MENCKTCGAEITKKDARLNAGLCKACLAAALRAIAKNLAKKNN